MLGTENKQTKKKQKNTSKPSLDHALEPEYRLQSWLAVLQKSCPLSVVVLLGSDPDPDTTAQPEALFLNPTSCIKA